MFKSSAVVINNDPIFVDKDGKRVHTIQFSELGYYFTKNPDNPKEMYRMVIVKDWDSEGKKPAKILPFDLKIARKYGCLKEWYQKDYDANKAVLNSANQIRRKMPNLTLSKEPPAKKSYEIRQAPKRIEQYTLDELAKMSVTELMNLVSDNFKK